jgi:hypothetical protein
VRNGNSGVRSPASLRVVGTTPPEVVTADATIAEIVRRSRRRTGGVPIRRTFVQGGPQQAPEPGPLASFVTAHDERALDLYLLVLALASHEPWRAELAGRVWGRALGLGEHKAALATVSKTFRRLEDRGLIARSRTGRRLSIALLREDGSGETYAAPNKPERWFRLPLTYWDPELRWYEKLSLPGKAMLLIAVSLRSPFYLPYEKSKDWYGISADSAAKGLTELNRHGLLTARYERKVAPLAPEGFTTTRYYTLKPTLGAQVPERRLARRHIGANGNP